MQNSSLLLFFFLVLLITACDTDRPVIDEFELAFIIDNKDGNFDSTEVEVQNNYILKRIKYNQDTTFELYQVENLLTVFDGLEVESQKNLNWDKYGFSRVVYYNEKGDTLDVRDYGAIDRLDQSSTSLCIMNFPFDGVNSFE